MSLLSHMNFSVWNKYDIVSNNFDVLIHSHAKTINSLTPIWIQYD